jgi:hypothetical protein
MGESACARASVSTAGSGPIAHQRRVEAIDRLDPFGVDILQHGFGIDFLWGSPFCLNGALVTGYGPIAALTNRCKGACMNDEERASLVVLISRTREILDWVVLDRGSNVPPHLRHPLRDAWTDVTNQRFTELEDRIGSGDYDEELDRHGLSGPELRAKLAAFEAPYRAWADLERRTRRRRFRRPSRTELTT